MNEGLKGGKREGLLMLDQMLVFTQLQLLSRQDRGWADGQTVKANNCCSSIILRLNVLNVRLKKKLFLLKHDHHLSCDH